MKKNSLFVVFLAFGIVILSACGKKTEQQVSQNIAVSPAPTVIGGANVPVSYTASVISVEDSKNSNYKKIVNVELVEDCGNYKKGQKMTIECTSISDNRDNNCDNWKELDNLEPKSTVHYHFFDGSEEVNGTDIKVRADLVIF